MNRYIIVFTLVSFLTVGSILVYSKNNLSTPNNQNDSQSNEVVNPTSIPTKAERTIVPNMNTQQEEVKELKIEDEKKGGGAEVKSGDKVEVNYTGTLLNGTKFDSSYDRDQTFSFTVGAGEVIQGWDQGLIGMRVGGKRKLTIPADMGYGEQGSGPIPPNSPLLFEIDLVSIK